MAGTQLQVRVDADLLAWIDSQRGDASRPEFVRLLAEYHRKSGRSFNVAPGWRERAAARAKEQVEPRFKS